MARTTSGARVEAEESPDSVPPTLPSPKPFIRIAPMRTVTEYRFVHEEPHEEPVSR